MSRHRRSLGGKSAAHSARKSSDVVSMFEPLEGRTMFSAAPGVTAVAAAASGVGQSLLQQATPLNDLGFRRRDIVAGSVSGSQTHAVFSFDVTDPITLRFALARLS